ncbi:MAG TPA: MT-A70 family methyltransferase [Solirubrobacterales bacterium]|nr:MT-A70 family methyltransferase [Solirubrobacterales bacterium]
MSGKYRTIVADPPWPFEWTGGGAVRSNGRGDRHLNQKFKKGLQYETMPVEDIAALPVDALADKDAHLFLWIPECHLIADHAATVLQGWGFDPGRARNLIWKKTGYGLGTWPRPQHETMVVCVRGKLPFAVRDQGSVVEASHVYENGARKHSAKPDVFLDKIEQASPGPYLELFARRARFCWDYYGDESLGTADLPEAVT